MSLGDLSSTSRDSTASSSTLNSAVSEALVEPSTSASTEYDNEAMHDESLWNLPGFDKTTFYAAALYLHAAAGQLKAPPVRSMEPQTDEKTRNFLDRLADCFAWSKSPSARAHVTATALVRDDTERKITVYIAKNDIDQGPDPGRLPQTLDKRSTQKWNHAFADILFGWFNAVACEDAPGTRSTMTPSRRSQTDTNDRVWEILLQFNESRLEYYIRRIRDTKIEEADRSVLEAENKSGWVTAMDVMSKCQNHAQFQESYSPLGPTTDQATTSTGDCVLAAYHARRNRDFRNLLDNGSDNEEADDDENIDNGGGQPSADSHPSEYVLQLIKWIDYLGRIRAAYASFIQFCNDHRGYSFRSVLLESPKGNWPGTEYSARINAWAGNLGLDDEREDGRTVRSVIDKVVEAGCGLGNIHCEMQLLMHFNRPGQQECQDYFGCSKRSCWLCWQVMSRCTRYTTKGTHFAIYPRWVLPALRLDSSKPEMAQGLNSAYEYMLSQIRRKVIYGIDISSQQRKTHSSPRLTLQHLRDHDIPEVPKPDPFSTDEILVPGREEIAVVAAICLPSNPSYQEPREVRLGLYEDRNDPDDMEYMMHKFAYRGKTVLTAPQVLTKLESFKGAEPEDFEQSTWMAEAFGILDFHGREHTTIFEFTMLYRTLTQGMSANPWILRCLERKMGQVREEVVPWRGDMFILYTPHRPRDPFEIQESLIDKDRALEVLRDWVCSENYDDFTHRAQMNWGKIQVDMITTQAGVAEAEAKSLLALE